MGLWHRILINRNSYRIFTSRIDGCAKVLFRTRRAFRGILFSEKYFFTAGSNTCLFISSRTEVRSFEMIVMPLAGFMAFINSLCFKIVQIVDVFRSYYLAKSTPRTPCSCFSMISCFISGDVILFFLLLSSLAIIFIGLLMNHNKG